eukprot:5691436-Alexandrium_andersonii.AAC.1
MGARGGSPSLACSAAGTIVENAASAEAVGPRAAAAVPMPSDLGAVSLGPMLLIHSFGPLPQVPEGHMGHKLAIQLDEAAISASSKA